MVHDVFNVQRRIVQRVAVDRTAGSLHSRTVLRSPVRLLRLRDCRPVLFRPFAITPVIGQTSNAVAAFGAPRQPPRGGFLVLVSLGCGEICASDSTGLRSLLRWRRLVGFHEYGALPLRRLEGTPHPNQAGVLRSNEGLPLARLQLPNEG